MREHTAAVLARYAVLQVPGMFVAAVVLVLLVRWEQISTGLAWALFGFWVLKDAVMFPFVRVGYESKESEHAPGRMIGATGSAQQELVPGREGYVKVGAELWRASIEGDEPLPAGAEVRVVAVRGLTLRVARADP